MEHHAGPALGADFVNPGVVYLIDFYGMLHELFAKLVIRVWNQSLVVYFVCFSPIICKETVPWMKFNP